MFVYGSDGGRRGRNTDLFRVVAVVTSGIESL